MSSPTLALALKKVAALLMCLAPDERLEHLNVGEDALAIVVGRQHL